MTSSARIDELQRKYEENPRRYFAPLASELRRAGELRRAVELCESGLRADPGHLSGYVVLGQALADLGDRTAAEGAFGRAVELDPENVVALRQLGDLARDRGDDAAARRWYQGALEADPRDPELATRLSALEAATAQPAGLRQVDSAGGEAPPPPAVESAAAEDAGQPVAASGDASVDVPAVALLDEAQMREFQDQRDAQEFTAGFFAALLDAQASDAAEVDHAAALAPASAEAELHVEGQQVGEADELSGADGWSLPSAGASPAADAAGAPGEWSDAGEAERPPEVTVAEERPDVRPDEGEFLDDLMELDGEAGALHDDSERQPLAEAPPVHPSSGSFDAREPELEPDEPEAIDLEFVSSRSGAEVAEAQPFQTTDSEPGLPPSSAEWAMVDLPMVDSRAADVAPVEQEAVEEAPVARTPEGVPPVAQATAEDGITFAQARDEEQFVEPEPFEPEAVGPAPAEATMVAEPAPDAAEPIEQEAVETEPVDREPVDAASPERESADAEPESEPVAEQAEGDRAPVEEESSNLPFVTATMGTLLLQQGFRNDALQIFRQLSAQNPDDAELRARIAELEGELAPRGEGASEPTVSSWLRRLVEARPASAPADAEPIRNTSVDAQPADPTAVVTPAVESAPVQAAAIEAAPAGTAPVESAAPDATRGEHVVDDGPWVEATPAEFVGMAAEEPPEPEHAPGESQSGAADEPPRAHDETAHGSTAGPSAETDLLAGAAAAAASAVSWDATESPAITDALFFGDDPLDWGQVTESHAAPPEPPAAPASALTFDEMLGRPVPSDDETAAGALAAATMAMQGDAEVDAALAAASAEDPMALDHLLTPAPPAAAGRGEGASFSFEQFFRVDTSATGADASAGADAQPPRGPVAGDSTSGQSTGAVSDDEAAAREADLADFHAWLAGLSKS